MAYKANRWNTDEVYWRCEECGYKDKTKPMPPNRNKFYENPKAARCPICKSKAMMPVGF